MKENVTKNVSTAGQITTSSTRPHDTSTPAPAGALYRIVWRWHFYAGLVLSPFIVLLAITGAIYLWKPQFEEWRYASLLHVSPPSTASKTVSSDAQLTAATQATAPGSQITTYTPPSAPDRSAEFVFRNGDEQTSVFIDPYTARVLGERQENTRLMNTVHDLHGEILMGKTGAIIVELAGTWVFVMVLTGFYLNWPRPRFMLRGFIIPRLRSGRHILKRDLHVVPAVWVSGFLLVILATGIPWTTYAGQWLDVYSDALGQGRPKESSASAHRSEVLGGWSPYMKNADIKRRLENVASVAPTSSGPESLAHDDHVGHGKEPLVRKNTLPGSRIPLSRVKSIVSTLKLQSNYSVTFPEGEIGVYSVITDRNKPFVRAFIYLDQYSGKMLADVRYKDFGLIAQPVMWGIILHEGQLFGLPNQIIGLVVCLGVLGIVFSGYALWWSRRPRRETAFGAPPRPSRAVFPRSVVWGTVVLGIFLPLLGATLLVLFVLDKVFTPRLKVLSTG